MTNEQLVLLLRYWEAEIGRAVDQLCEILTPEGSVVLERFEEIVSPFYDLMEDLRDDQKMLLGKE